MISDEGAPALAALLVQASWAIPGGRAGPRRYTRAWRARVPSDGPISTYTQSRGGRPRRAWLAHYGAPLYGQSALSGRAAPELERLVVDALGLSRRDPSMTRALPVLLWRRRGDIDLVKLVRLAQAKGRERTLGFFLDLAARLSGDRRLQTRRRRPCGRRPHAPPRTSSRTSRGRLHGSSPTRTRRPWPAFGATA